MITGDARRRTTALMAAVAMAAAFTACGSATDPPSASSSSSPPSSSTAHSSSCLVRGPGPTAVDDAFTNVPGFIVDNICPVDVDPSLKAHASEFLADNAGKMIQNDSPILSVFAGQLKSGQGDAFVRAFLADLSTRAAPKTLAAEPKDVRGYAVTYFNVPVGVTGYAYAEGPTVVIAYDLAGGPTADTAEEALSTILANLFTGP